MSEKLSAIVTTGGTVEAIDDVRAITNFSSGAMGKAIVWALTSCDYQGNFPVREITCMSPQGVNCTPSPSTSSPFRSEEDYKSQHFTSAASLDKLLQDHPPVDLIFHAAAVADYTPVNVEVGKISSDRDKLSIRLKRTPKILDSLRKCYPEAFIVGFKLLSGATPEQLYSAAHSQLERAKTDLVVANDLKQINDHEHPITLFTPDHLKIDITGSKLGVAQDLIRFVFHEVLGHSPIAFADPLQVTKVVDR